MLVFALLGRGDGDQLDLGELMLPDHAARIFARRAGLGAKARRAGGEPHRQLRFVEDGFADEIGQRDFGGGDEPPARDIARFHFVKRTIFRFFISQGIDKTFNGLLRVHFPAKTLFVIGLNIRKSLSPFCRHPIHERLESRRGHLKLVFLKFRQLRCTKHDVIAHE